MGAAHGADAGGSDGIHDEMDATELVHKEVAGDAGAVILIVPPAEQPHGLEGTLGRTAQKAIPVNGLCRCVRRNAILPSALRRAAIPEGLHHMNLPDGAFADQIAGLLI